MDASNFKAPFISKDKCWERADDFRRQFWARGCAPVDVIEIAEIELDLELRTIAKLKEDSDTDALLLSNWTTILVDERQYMDERYINRLKFSVAHELGHLVLHKDIFESIPRNTISEWISFMQKLPEDQYGFLEFQANEFAGRLLVPKDQLGEAFEKVLQKAESGGLSRSKLQEQHLSYLCNGLIKEFEVSNEVIEKRLLKEEYWPITT